MMRVTWRNLLARKLRLLLSTFAIVLGVAFVAGSLIFTDTLERALQRLFDGTTGDVVVRPAGRTAIRRGSLDTRTIPGRVVDELRASPGSRGSTATSRIRQVYVVGKDGKVVGGSGPPGARRQLHRRTRRHTAERSCRSARGGRRTGPDEVALDEGPPTRRATPSATRCSSSPPGRARGSASPRLVGSSTSAPRAARYGATLTIFDTGACSTCSSTAATPTPTSGHDRGRRLARHELRDAASGVLPAGLRGGHRRRRRRREQGLHRPGALVPQHVPADLRRRRAGRRRLPDRQHVLDPGRPAQPRAGAAAGAGRLAAAGHPVGAARGVRGRASRLDARPRLGGFLLALGLRGLFARFGLDLTGAARSFGRAPSSCRTPSGVVVTMVAAWLPARRTAGSRRSRRCATTSRCRSRRCAAGFCSAWRSPSSVLALLGVGLFADTGNSAAVVGGGILGVLLGVGPDQPGDRPAAPAPARVSVPQPFGTVGQLAGQNSLRNPRRTAATASALMIGLALVSTMSILGDSAKASVDKRSSATIQSATSS